MTNPVAPKTDTPAMQIPLPLICTYDPGDHHEIKFHDGSGFYGDGNGKYWCDVHEIRRLESTLAAERASRVQADTEQFNAGIEAARNYIANYFDRMGTAARAERIRKLPIRVAPKPSVSPEQEKP